MRGKVKADKKGEDPMKEMGTTVKEVFRGFEETFARMKPPNWWGNNPSSPTNGVRQQLQQQESQCVASGNSPNSPTGGKPDPATTPGFFPIAGLTASLPSASEVLLQPPAWPAAREEDDAAMRRHCAALERLVEMGLSPQAARVALQHLDAWLVGEGGAAELASAEAAAYAAGETILHVGDQVRLEGLVKNKSVNGKLGTLQDYQADSHRWKVGLSDNEVFWVKSKWLRPLELRRLPLPTPDAVREETDTVTTKACHSTTLSAGWALLEARQAVWKEEHEARDIELLEREESLRKAHETLEAQQQQLGERIGEAQGFTVATMAPLHHQAQQQLIGKCQLPLDGVQGRIAAVAPTSDRQVSMTSTAGDCSPARTVASFALGGQDDSPEDPRSISRDARVLTGSSAAEEDPPNEEADEMWDMDWTTLATNTPSGGASASTDAVIEQAVDMPADTSPAAVAHGLPVTKVASPTPAVAMGAPVWRLSREPSPPPVALGSVATAAAVPVLATPERESLQQKMHEKRILAELHNGKDLFAEKLRGEFAKGPMPGVQGEIADRLEERRRQLDLAEVQGDA